jgi:hypothetical protein
MVIEGILRTKGTVIMILLYYYLIVFGLAVAHCHNQGSVRSSSRSISLEDIGECVSEVMSLFYSEIIMYTYEAFHFTFEDLVCYSWR